MNRRLIALSSAATALVLTVALPFSATAATAEPSDAAVSDALTAELQQLTQASGGTVTFEPASVDVTAELVEAAGSTDPAAIADYILEQADLSQTAQNAPATSSAQRAPLAAPLAAAASKTVNYTADQNTTLPSFGVAWVNQDMSVTFTGNTINSVRLKGNSYGTGISLFAYSHINTTLEYRKNRTCLRTYMKGTFSAIVKGSAVNFAATVLASDAPRNGNMVSVLYTEC